MKRVQSNKLDFSGQNIYVGIDVHLKSWSVAILSVQFFYYNASLNLLSLITKKTNRGRLPRIYA